VTSDVLPHRSRTTSKPQPRFYSILGSSLPAMASDHTVCSRHDDTLQRRRKSYITLETDPLILLVNLSSQAKLQQGAEAE
jgi:hypothetical protein